MNKQSAAQAWRNAQKAILLGLLALLLSACGTFEVGIEPVAAPATDNDDSSPRDKHHTHVCQPCGRCSANGHLATHTSEHGDCPGRRREPVELPGQRSQQFPRHLC